MKDPEIKTLNELKIFIASEFSKIHKDLKEINKILQGNGKASMEVRMDRLEKLKNWALWIIGALATALVAGLIAHYFSLIEKLIGK